MKQVMKVVAAVLGGIAVLILIAAMSFGWRWVTAPFTGALEQRETVQSGAFRMYSYEHFYDLCAAVQRNERALMSQKRALEQADGNKNRIRQRIVGLESQLQSKISTYNQDARKEETTGQFRAAGLPRHIDYNPEEITRCGKM